MTKQIFRRPLLAATAFTALCVIATSARAATGDIFETNETNIIRLTTAGATPGTFATGLGNPKGLVFDGNGHLYVADASRNEILIFAVPDGAGTIFVTGLSSPIGLAFDTSGNLYEADSGSGTIFKFTPPDATKTPFVTGVGAPAGLAFDNNGNLFVADFSGGKVYKVTPAGTLTTFATGLKNPAGLAFDASGNLFEADSGSGSIFQFAPDGTQTTFVSTGLSRPYGLAFEATGNLVVADNGAGATLRFSPTATKTVIFASNFNTPQFLAVAPAQHQVLNISTRGLVQSGNNVLIAGFTIGGNGPVGTSIVVRALGPSLAAFGIDNALPDPVLELRDASGTLLASNNDWKDSQQTAIQNSNLAPTDDHESAIITSLHGGAFTAIVRSATGEPGLALVEVYNLQ
ncbi:MAG TPA: NHL repeat-containing protein [Chthoniobacterales bacterium]